MPNPFAVLFERRSGAISDSHGLYELLSRGFRSLSGVTVNENSAMALAAVSTCVRIISRSISTLPADVIERQSERVRVPALKHWARLLLIRPNGWMTWQDLICFVVVHILLRGNAYLFKVRDASNPKVVTELLPLHPDQIEVEQGPFPELAISYKWTTREGRAYKFTQNEIVHFRNVSSNGVVGRSVLQDHKETFGAGIATQAHAGTYWGRGGLPSVILRHPSQLKPAAKKNLETFWENTYGGGAEQKRVAVIEEGMSLEQITPKLAEAQYIETRGFTEGEVFGIYQVPRFLSGNTEKATTWGTGIEQQFIGLMTLCLTPYVIGIEQRFNRDVIGDPSDRFSLKLYLQGFMRGDSAARALYYRVMREVGAYSANDIRGLEDLNPLAEGGDVYLQPTNLAPLGWSPTPSPAKEPKE
jgi:HK97 family phage portal protein